MSTPSDNRRARLWQLGYRLLYRTARVWWFVRRPHTRGALVALWHDGRVLLVRSSYRNAYGLPGGFVNRREHSRDAAVRELKEEVHVTLPPEALAAAWQGTIDFENRHDAVTIWEATMNTAPPVRIDGREVIWAGWERPEEALRRDLLPQVEEYLVSRQSSVVTPDDGRPTTED